MSECTMNSKRVRANVAGAQSFRGAGGWRCDLTYQSPDKKLHGKVLVGGCRKASQYRMTLAAAVAALKQLKEPCIVEMATCCDYTLDCCNRLISGKRSDGWTGRVTSGEVKNSDLLQELAKLVKAHAVRMVWVPYPSKDRNFYHNLKDARFAARQAEGGRPVNYAA